MTDRTSIECELAEARQDLHKREAAIHGLQGIFWALNQLVIHHVADDVAREQDLDNGIAGLIVAGMELTRAVADDF